jgi:hypothetical protein
MVSHVHSVESTKATTTASKISVRALERLVETAFEEAEDLKGERLKTSSRHFHVSRSSMRQVALVLAGYANFTHGDCYPTVEKIGQKIRRSTKCVQRALRALETVGLVETFTGRDAWTIHGRDPKAQDARRHAYGLPPVRQALGLERRAPLQDTRTSWQKHCARVGLRQQKRQAQRELERVMGERGILLSRDTRTLAEHPAPPPRVTRRAGEVAHAGKALNEALDGVHQMADTKSAQPLRRQGEGACKAPFTSSAQSTMPKWNLQRLLRAKETGQNRGESPPE